MNKHTITKAMINAAVSRGLKEMEEDPKRSVRRLADLGRQFSNSRFQNTVFSIMQEILANEDSPYYDMMATLLKNTDHDALRTFGINIGYNGWTYGARLLRSQEESCHFALPSEPYLHYDNTDSKGMNIAAMDQLITKGTELGIYIYHILEEGACADSYELVNFMSKYADCAFMWYRPRGRLTAAQIQMMKGCKNAVVVLPADDPESALTASLLRDQKILFAISQSYTSKDVDAALQEKESSVLLASLRTAIAAESTFLFLMADESDGSVLGKQCYEARLHPKSPCFPIDCYADVKNISRIIVDHETMLELDADGRILQPADHKGEAFDFAKSLEESLQAIMPAMQM